MPTPTPTTSAKWRATGNALIRSQQWPELWRLAQEAPLKWCVRLLKRFGEANSDWRPTDEAAAACFSQLMQIAMKCSEENFPIGWPHLGCSSIKHGSYYGYGSPALAVSSDGQILVSSSRDGQIRLRSLPDGRLIKRIKAYSMVDHWSSVIVSHDHVFASYGCSGNVQIRSPPDGRLLTKLEVPDDKYSHSVSGLAITSDGRTLAENADKGIRLWSIPDGRLLQTLDRLMGSGPIALTPDGQLVIGTRHSSSTTICLLSIPGPARTLGAIGSLRIVCVNAISSLC